MNQNERSVLKDQRGIASIIVTMLVIFLLTLVVLAMSRNATREQRQSLDRQLNSQAFYAAESGVNDTLDYVLNNADAQPEKDKCDGLDGANQLPDRESVIDAQGPISYSCVLYDTRPESIVTDVTTSSAYITPIESNEDISTLTISWKEQGDTGTGNCSAIPAGNVPVAEYPSECKAGYLRAELIDSRANPATGVLTRDDLISKNMTAYIKPGGSGPFVNISKDSAQGNNQGRIVQATCDGTKCQAVLTGIGLQAGDKMFLRISSIYKNNSVTVEGHNAASNIVQFIRSQLVVDVTGKASDVLKRIQVRVPLSSQSQYQREYPQSALSASDGICKLLTVTPGNTSTDTACPLP